MALFVFVDGNVPTLAPPPLVLLQVFTELKVDTPSPLANSSEGPEDFRKMDGGSSVMSSITTLNSSISLNLPDAVKGPAEEDEGGLPLLVMHPLPPPLDDLRLRRPNEPRWIQIFTRSTERMTPRQQAILIAT